MTRPTGLTKDAGWQVGVRRTISLDPETAWALVSSPQGMQIWLGKIDHGQLQEGDLHELPDGTRVEMRVCRPGSHMRLTRNPGNWEEPSTIQVRVISKGEKSVIAFHEENLPSQAERLRRREHFQKVLTELKRAAG